MVERTEVNDACSQQEGMGFFGGWFFVLVVCFVAAPFIWIADFIKGEARK